MCACIHSLRLSVSADIANTILKKVQVFQSKSDRFKWRVDFYDQVERRKSENSGMQVLQMQILEAWF